MKLRLQFADAAASIAQELRQQAQRLFATERAVIAGDVAGLHDLRVSIRRLRVLLRALEEPLAPTTATALAQRWQIFSNALSPLRDADVWRGLLRELPGVTPAFLRQATALLKKTNAHPGALLRSPTWARLKRDTQRLLAEALPAALAKPGQRTRPTPALRRCWKECVARAAKRAAHPRWREAERAHKLRIACRRARYLAEFFATAVADRQERRQWQQLARRYRAAQSGLGQTHDADVLLEFLLNSNLRPPAALVAELRKRRTAGLARFSRVWKKMAG
jgi:CHAD domain-containing protein